MTVLNESTVEDAALEYLRQLGYSTAFGPDIAPDGPVSERASYEQVFLKDRLFAAMSTINPTVETPLIEGAIKRLFRVESQNELAENFRMHKLLSEGIPVEHRTSDDAIRTSRVQLINFENPENNDWLAVN